MPKHNEGVSTLVGKVLSGVKLRITEEFDVPIIGFRLKYLGEETEVIVPKASKTDLLGLMVSIIKYGYPIKIDKNSEHRLIDSIQKTRSLFLEGNNYSQQFIELIAYLNKKLGNIEQISLEERCRLLAIANGLRLEAHSDSTESPIIKKLTEKISWNQFSPKYSTPEECHCCLDALIVVIGCAFLESKIHNFGNICMEV